MKFVPKRSWLTGSACGRPAVGGRDDPPIGVEFYFHCFVVDVRRLRGGTCALVLFFARRNEASGGAIYISVVLTEVAVAGVTTNQAVVRQNIEDARRFAVVARSPLLLDCR